MVNERCFMKYKKIFPLFVLFLLAMNIVSAVNVVRPGGRVLQSIIGEDSFIKTADSETDITGGLSCSVIHNTQFTSCESNWYTINKEGSGGTLLVGLQPLISGSDTALKTRSGAYIYVKLDIKKKYYRASANLQAQRDSTLTTSFSLSESPHPIESEKILQIRGSLGSPMGVEVIPSVIVPNLLVVMINGIKMAEVDVSNWDAVYPVFGFEVDYDTHSWSLINSRYQYLFSCQKDDDEILGAVTYAGGQSISLTAEGKLPTIEQKLTQFCPTHGAILTDQSENGSTETNEFYYALAKGDTVTLQNDQTLTLFGIFDATGLPVTCAEEVYDFKTKTCQEISGFVTFLRQGTLDSETGTFITEPTIVCQLGEVPNGVYVLDEDACIVYQTAEIRCVDEASGFVFSASDDGCIIDLEVETVASEEECSAEGADFVWYDDTKQCIEKLPSECEDAGAEPVKDENGHITKCLIPAEKALEVSETSDLTDQDCQSEFGSTASVATNDAGDAYACVVNDVTNLYWCGGQLLSEDEVCAVENAEDVQTFQLITIDASDVNRVDKTTLYIVIGLISVAFVLWVIKAKTVG